MSFEPIAIVGQACVLPGALSPAALWQAVLQGRDLTSAAPPERWRMPAGSAMCQGESDSADRTWSDRGGYVSGFEGVFDPEGFGMPAEEVAKLDPLFRWLLHTGRAALRDAGHAGHSDRVGAVVGNLSFPSAGLARFAEQRWLGGEAPIWAGERFSSGLPAHLLGLALGLGAGAYALDAACASSLYAMKLACDRLHDRSADLMLAGAVNCCDDLFIHVGFCALRAMSRSGRSRPFHAGADGLVPAEGSAVVALKRLNDAIAAGDRVYGVIRGVGLSNDGRGRGLLVPDDKGQARAMAEAWRISGLDPAEVGLLECHATGTPVGDATELRSMGQVFGGSPSAPVGSLKSNLGHLVTAAGAAGLIKVLAAFEAGIRPPTLHIDQPIAVPAPFRLLAAAEPWTGRRLAGISAFGFGGNNAHLVVEQSCEPQRRQVAISRPEVAVVGLGVVLGELDGAAAFADAWISGREAVGRTESVKIPLRGLRSPPKDLEQTLGQQTLLLRAAHEALAGLEIDGERAGVFVGMGVDPEVARYGARWRLASRLSGPALAQARDGVVPVLESAGVVGTMPNIPANRLSSQFDLRGPGFTVSSEERSGLVALSLAAEALAAGEIDLALVGASDLSCEPVHQEALRQLGLDRRPADAAVVLLLRRAEDASSPLALLGGAGEPSLILGEGGPADACVRFGYPHAAVGLVELAAAIAACARGIVPADRCAEVRIAALGGQRSTARVRPAGPAPLRAYAPEGPLLTLSAHFPPVTPLEPPVPSILDALSEGLSLRPILPPEDRVQVMPPAPSLVAVLDDAPALAAIGVAAPAGGAAPVVAGSAPVVVGAAPVVVGSAPAAHGALAMGSGASAIGAGASATGFGASAIGAARIGSGVRTIDSGAAGIGSTASAIASTSSATGFGASAIGTAPPAIGFGASAIGTAPSAIGLSPSAAITTPSRSAPPAPLRATPPTDALGLLVEAQARLAQTHATFLQDQAAVHEQFLQLRQGLGDALIAGFEALSSGTYSPRISAQPTRPLTAPNPPAAVRPIGHAPVAAPPPIAPVPTAIAPTPATIAPAPVAAPNAIAPTPSAISAAPNTIAPAPNTIAPAPNAIAAAPNTIAPAPTTIAPTAQATASLPGLRVSREELVHLSAGRVSEIFGPKFAPQDRHAVQVRMPEPPLLLADRVVGLDAEPASMKLGTIWTETDVREDSWYLHERHMPAGIFIESGQADLLLISYLGVDLLNQGERAYRLLGCDLTWHAPQGQLSCLPAVGETLRYDIHVDGHANQGPVRLFFFHYDCNIAGQPRLTVRNGQAGFFTREELDKSMGVLWDAETGEHKAEARMDRPPVDCALRELGPEALRAFSEGRVRDCFGPGFEKAETHTMTPRISGGRMLFLDKVTHLERQGGPWGRGYLRAIDAIAPDDWFFAGHFHNDPCMPGTLMFEGCLQAMAVYMASLGVTLPRDGWRFEPVPGETYKLRCRGQVVPTSRELSYEVFVEEFIAGPIPTLYADLLCIVDGLKAFHCRRMGLRLVPDWPLERIATALRDPHEGTVATVDGFTFNYHSLLSCAWGRPSEAFGPMYARYDGARPVARLPGPPYHFMSRVSSVDGPLGGMHVGSKICIEYDVPVHEWFYENNGARTTPYAVVLEAALQPCGWLASYIGSTITTEEDLYFRNLDGTATMHADLLPGAGVMRTYVTLTGVSKSGPMIIESFDVECEVEGQKLFSMKTVFGFFPLVALQNQAGLSTTDADREALNRPSNTSVALRARPARYFSGSLRLPGQGLLMIDRLVGWWPEGGKAGLGTARCEKDVHPTDWYFKAHFYQDPVQPGSLGIEAMIQLLQLVMLEKGLGEGIAEPRFEPIRLGSAMTWKYRGQVTPDARVVSCTLELTEVGRDERGAYAVADASLWVDGKRIYEAKNMGMRVVSGLIPPAETSEVLDPKGWLADHQPTFTVPALPMMSMVERLAAAADALGQGRPVVGLQDVQVKRWLPVPAPTRVFTHVGGSWDRMEVELNDDAGRVANAKVHMASRYPDGPVPWTPCEGEATVNPYESGRLFHGPALRLLRSLVMGPKGSSSVLDAGGGSTPPGLLNQGLLDAMTHGIPHDHLELWDPSIPADHVAYPAWIPQLRLFGPMPRQGLVRCEVRYVGQMPPKMVAFDIQLIGGDRVICELRLVEALFPKGPIGRAEPQDRAAFLRDRAYVPTLSLSREQDGETVLDRADLRASAWLPGTITQLYGVASDEAAREVALKEHVARRAQVHPSKVTLEGELGRTPRLPLTAFPTQVDEGPERVTVRDAGPPVLDLEFVRTWWLEKFNVGRWPVEDLYYGLIRRFIGKIVVEDPEAMAAVAGQSLLYLANHQVGIESLLFSVLASALNRVPTVTLAKAEHRNSWLGGLIRHSFQWPGVVDPRVITYFDREDKASLPKIIGELAADMSGPGRSVMVHVEGTRSLSCREPVQKMSGAFLDMAMAVQAPVVPVRFVGALPTEPLTERAEFPVGMGRQDIYLGRPILPASLAKMPYGERKKLVVSAINALGPSNELETPNPGDPAFAEAVRNWSARYGVREEDAVLGCVLAEQQDTSEEVRRLLAREPLGESPAEQWLKVVAGWIFGGGSESE